MTATLERMASFCYKLRNSMALCFMEPGGAGQ
jgi:hypothetical protein